MHVNFSQSFCRAALARRDITPPVGMYHRMWGAATHDRSTGIHRPLFATALAIEPDAPENGNRQLPQVLVSIDHCLLWTEQMDALRAAVCRATGLAGEQLHVTFSHTHAAGLLDPERADLPGGELIAGYLVTLAEHTAEAVNEARGSLQPARFVYGRGRCDVAAHRDLWDEQSRQFVCGFNPTVPADDTLLIARITDGHGKTLGTIVNYACHPTTLAWDNTLVSPDFVGAMRELVERDAGGLCLFLQGASGDVGPRVGFVGDVAAADRNGRQLGHAALAALEALPAPGLRFEYTGPVVSGATIGTWDYRPLAPEILCEKHRWQCRRTVVELPLRTDLPSRESTEAQLADWQAKELAAERNGELAVARDCRAQAERSARQLARLRSLPSGSALPLVVNLWHFGDAIWILVPGEYYNVFQRALRDRFADHPIIVATITNGWHPGYLPTAATYGQGIYQESIAAVAPGALEHLIATLSDEIASQLASSAKA